MTLLSTRLLSKQFDGLVAVDRVDFDLDVGERRAIIGPNGAGKSTFVSMLCGRIPSSSGRIEFDDRDITDWPAHRRIALGMAYTFQITAVFGRLTLEENVALAVRRAHGGTESRVRERSLVALERVGLHDRARALAGDQSYGHQRLLEIAMGLAQSPRLFILDEPTQGLAESEIAGFLELLSSFDAATTVLLIEHNMDVVMAAASRITVLDAGTTLAEGSPEEIRADSAVQAAYLGHSPGAESFANNATSPRSRDGAADEKSRNA